MKASILSKGSIIELPVTENEVLGQLRLADTPDDLNMQNLITNATSTAEAHCNLAIAKRSYTLTLDELLDEVKVMLPVWPVDVTQDITITVCFDDGTTQDISHEIKSHMLNRIPPVMTSAAWGINTDSEVDYILVECIAGYGINAAEHLKQAILMLCSEFYENRENSGKKDEMSWGIKNLLGYESNLNV